MVEIRFARHHRILIVAEGWQQFGDELVEFLQRLVASDREMKWLQRAENAG